MEPRGREREYELGGENDVFFIEEEKDIHSNFAKIWALSLSQSHLYWFLPKQYKGSCIC